MSLLFIPLVRFPFGKYCVVEGAVWLELADEDEQDDDEEDEDDEEEDDDDDDVSELAFLDIIISGQLATTSWFVSFNDG